ncbi:MAG: flagellar protein FlgN [bacterium]|jgi:flagellar biosynthesis/type III secretory pathway chaperone|nr:flagellar protein FlgN [bacterium]
MMDIQPLIALLAQEQKIYEQLLAAKKRERRLLLTLNAKELVENTQTIMVLADHMRELEYRRTEWTAETARILGMKTAEPTLHDFLQTLPIPERDELEQAGERLKSLVGKIQHENEMNAVVLRQSNDAINTEICTLAQTEKSDVYKAGGKKCHATVPRAGINIRI